MSFHCKENKIFSMFNSAAYSIQKNNARENYS